MRSHGTLAAVGVEGSGAYGAELARVLTAAGVTVVDVDRPDRKTRRMRGKSDPIDAYAAATAVASGRATGVPKSRDGVVEAVRVLRCARRSAVKARTQAINQIRGLLVSAPTALREQVAHRDRTALIRTLARLRSGTDLSTPLAATKAALRRLARRHQALDAEITELDTEISPLVKHAAPKLLGLFGVGPETAGQLLASAGDNPERLRSESAFAHLAGVAPIPASSGRTHRHRLNRGGDRAANNALHTIVLVRRQVVVPGQRSARPARRPRPVRRPTVRRSEGEGTRRRSQRPDSSSGPRRPARCTRRSAIGHPPRGRRCRPSA
jgi:transposase